MKKIIKENKRPGMIMAYVGFILGAACLVASIPLDSSRAVFVGLCFCMMGFSLMVSSFAVECCLKFLREMEGDSDISHLIERGIRKTPVNPTDDENPPTRH